MQSIQKQNVELMNWNANAAAYVSTDKKRREYQTEFNAKVQALLFNMHNLNKDLLNVSDELSTSTKSEDYTV